MKRKGISPLIAAVLLIAFTMAVAGLLATWATQFVGGRMGGISEEAQCIGSLYVERVRFSDTNASFIITNLNDQLNLTEFKGSLYYESPSMNQQNIIFYNGSLGPGDSYTIIYNTGSTTKPDSGKVRASNCKKYPVDFSFD